jgi:hypothetical protein
MTTSFTRLVVLTLALLAAVSGNASVFEPTLGADDAHAVVYLYRPAAQQPGLAKPLRRAYPEVLLDGEPVGTLPYNRYLSFRVTPGNHTVRVTGLSRAAKGWELRDLEQKISAEAGQTLFLRLKVEFNTQEMNIGQPKASYRYWLGPVDANDAVYESTDSTIDDGDILVLLAPVDEGERWSHGDGDYTISRISSSRSTEVGEATDVVQVSFDYDGISNVELMLEWAPAFGLLYYEEDYDSGTSYISEYVRELTGITLPAE